uniref:Uncharacterized protein n=1 Tax=Glossina brevipalpis TaxID=37001 RepID=A0A1A9WZR2_9MUSC
MSNKSVINNHITSRTRAAILYYINRRAVGLRAPYETNDQMPVRFITHNMGSRTILVFLQQQTLEWKNKFIVCTKSLGVAWAGNVKAHRGEEKEPFSRAKLKRGLNCDLVRQQEKYAL